MKTEIWKDVLGYEGSYQVSTFGNVKSLSRKRFNKPGYVKERLLALNKIGQKRKYYCVGLFKNGVRTRHVVHILQAIAFLEHEALGYSGLVIDHVDNDSLNNHITNLQKITARENTSKDRQSTSKYQGVSWDKGRSKWRAMIRVGSNRLFLGRFNCELLAAVTYNNKLKSLN